MKVGNVTSRAGLAAQAIFDPMQAMEILSGSGVEWPMGRVPTDLRIERGWPERNGAFAAEWSFRLADRRCSIYASTSSPTDAEHWEPRPCPVTTPAGLRSLDVHLSSWNVHLHTPDCDAAMPHLARALDPASVGPTLEPYWSASQQVPNDTLSLNLLAYRAGKRAAIAFTRSNGARLLGKTFRGDRGERLMARHVDLATRLCHDNDKIVALRVAAPLGFIPSLNMAVFEWCDHGIPSAPRPSMNEVATRCADALAALHSVPTQWVEPFTRTDERTVIQRWHESLRVVAPSLADESAPLVDALSGLADDGDDTDHCTVHRDFYEKQLLYHNETMTLLDLDTLATGSPCVDVGNLLAHLCLANAGGRGGLETFLDLAAAVVSRYVRSRRAISRSALVFYWASAAFRVGAVHALRTATRVHTRALWGMAVDLLYHEGILPAPTVRESHQSSDFAPALRWTSS